MISIRYSLILVLAVNLMFPAFANEPSSQSESLTPEELINKITEGKEEIIEIDIPENYLLEIINESRPVSKRTQSNLRPGINKVDGYRIQVFGNGNNQHTLEARARARGNAIVAKFPKYRGQVYSFSKSPNWYTRIGNFKDQKSASAALAELKRAFPQYAAEMRIVKSVITIIK